MGTFSGERDHSTVWPWGQTRAYEVPSVDWELHIQGQGLSRPGDNSGYGVEGRYSGHVFG